jgi:hypothetical protein
MCDDTNDIDVCRLTKTTTANYFIVQTSAKGPEKEIPEMKPNNDPSIRTNQNS